MSKKSKDRLIWALRYCMSHPDLSPDILSKEWDISMDLSIELCANNVANILPSLRDDFQYEDLEEEIYIRLTELK